MQFMHINLFQLLSILQQLFIVVRMFALRLSKFLNPSVSMGFSKLKLSQFGSKVAAPGLKPAPNGLKKPPINKNEKITPKTDIKNNRIQSMLKSGIMETSIQTTDTPILKQKHAVVTIMGHVDHGKTTLIDFLRKSDIAQKEDGGITQRIGAFRINCLGQRITFIDTPGHEAFVNMRQRGASVTDLVVLVVSAVEGVKKQTLEVIQIIKKMQLPVIVAINKIDLPQANPEEVESELQKAGLKLQVNGGDIPVVHISAKEGLNVDLLCELIIQQTKDKTAVFEGMAEASVLEAFHTKDGSNSMTIIMQKGSLKTNSILILGNQSFRAKTILDDRGEFLKQAYPGEAVQVVGIPFIPSPGDAVFEVENQKKAKFVLQKNKQKSYEQQRQAKKVLGKEMAANIKFERSRQGRKEKRAFCRGVRQVWMNKFADEQEKMVAKIEQLRTLQQNEIVQETILQLEQKLQNHKQYVFEYLKNTGDSPDTLNFIIKFADRGMEETILMQLETLKPSIQQQTKVKLNLIKTDVGDVTIGDLKEAQNCGAKIFTFGCGVSSQAKHNSGGMEPPRTHKLIHTLLKDIKDTSFNKKMSTLKGTQRARCDVAEIYTLKQKKSQIVVPGIKVTNGKITKKCKAYVFRNAVPISEPLGISFIKSFKKQMLELKKGEEGTIGFHEVPEDLQRGDEIVFFQQF